MTRPEDCRILRETSTAERLRLWVNGTNTPVGGHVFRQDLANVWWAYRIQNFKLLCSGEEDHDPDFRRIEIAEIVGAYNDGTPFTLVTACACKRCGKSVRSAWGIEYELRIAGDGLQSEGGERKAGNLCQ
jgi:hypothetical protein